MASLGFARVPSHGIPWVPNGWVFSRLPCCAEFIAEFLGPPKVIAVLEYVPGTTFCFDGQPIVFVLFAFLVMAYTSRAHAGFLGSLVTHTHIPAQLITKIDFRKQVFYQEH